MKIVWNADLKIVAFWQYHQQGCYLKIEHFRVIAPFRRFEIFTKHVKSNLVYSVNLVKTAGALPEMLMTANIWVCLWKLLR